MGWAPPDEIGLDDLRSLSEQVLARPEKPVAQREEIFEIEAAGLRWVVGGEVFEPAVGDALRAGDGRRVGAFLLHGGGGDHRQMANLADLLARRFGVTAYTFTYPGHLNLDAPDRSWPGEPLDDGTGRPRLPIWDPADRIGHDEYDVVVDPGDEARRRALGTLFFLRAKPGSQFYLRQATWPLAYERAYVEACRRTFPESEYVVFMHGHSTGGPQAHMLLQRVPNAAGLFGLESSPFGAIVKKMHPPHMTAWELPFQDLTMRSWRDVARYLGTESRLTAADLPLMMERVFEQWDETRGRPGFKSEHYVQVAALGTLREAAVAAARHLRLDDAGTADLVERYHGYTRPDPNGRPLPPLMYVINRYSRDHRLDNYQGVLLPELARLRPPPRVSLTRLSTGVHNYNRDEDGLPRGTAPVAAHLWIEGLRHGFFDAPALD